jgi:hypothetical protein
MEGAVPWKLLVTSPSSYMLQIDELSCFSLFALKRFLGVLS